MKTKLLILFAFLITISGLKAQDFAVNGINYSIIDTTNNYVTVARNAGVFGNIVLPSTVNYTENGITKTYTVTKINTQAFQLSDVINITIPDSVTEIGEQAFSYCYSLQSVVLPNSITEISKQLFFRSSALTSITIPNSVTLIGESAFMECTNLKTVLLSNILEEIGVLAFSESGLENIELPNTLITLGASSFQSATKLKSIEIPDSVTSILSNVFKNCSSLATIKLPNTITRTGTNAFEGTAIKSITLPESLTRIDHYAFTGCTELEAITVPEAVGFIGISAFENCEKLATINIPQNVTFLNTRVFRGTGFISFTIPEHINQVLSGVLQNCKNLTSFTFPDHLLEVPQTILKGCTNLTSITIPDHYTSISSSAFENCAKLTSIRLPSSLVATGLGSSVFRYCTNLEQVENVPQNITSIPSFLFADCASLKTFEIPETVTTINGSAFSGCTNLDNIDLPTSLKTIQGYAFEDCTNLSSINFPGTLESIGVFTYKSCESLRNVKVNWLSPININVNVFDTIDLSLATLEVPANSEAVYRAAPVWMGFGSFLESDINNTDNLVVNGSAEIVPVVNNGWVLESGNWTTRSESPDPQEGSNYFYPSTSATAELYQDINVSKFSLDIDTGEQNFYFSAFLRSFPQGTSTDNSQVILEYRDDSDAILSTYDTGLSSESDSWIQFEDTRSAPVGTRKIRVRLLAFRNAGSSNDGYIDNVVLKKVGAVIINIPDANFEQHLVNEGIDSDEIINGQVLAKDIEEIATLDIRNKNIADLTGLESFISLTSLNATNNSISTIDVSKNLLLETLLVSQNQLTTINLSKNINLKNINLGENEFTVLSFLENINLETLNFTSNSISAIDFSKNVQLSALYVGNNNLENIDVSMLSDLEVLWCYNNQLSTLSLVNNAKLTSLDCSDNQIKVLNVDNNIALQQLFCSRNQLIALDVHKNTGLTEVICEQNSITYLDFSKNDNLTKVICNDNALIGLNMQNSNFSSIQNSDFSAFANPNLTCILIAENTTVNWSQIDMQTEIRTDCPDLVVMPDANFEAHLESLNLGNGILGDTYVDRKLLEDLTSLSIDSKNITNTKGLEYFTNLTFLDISDNGLTQVDVSNNILLETLLADSNELTTINLASNTKLKTFEARNNQLSSIDIATLVDLQRLELESNQITTLDLVTNPKISILDLKNNQLENLDVSNQQELVIFEANNNLLRFINLKNTANPTVSTLDTTNNPNLTCIEVLDVDYFENIAPSIDAHTKFYENCPSTTVIPDANFEAYLESINAGNGVIGDNLVLTEAIAVLTTLNVASKNIADLTGLNNFTNLVDLNAKDNSLTQIDISKNSLLEIINLENNELTNVDFSNNFGLKNINVGDNQISNIDVYFLTELESLQCYKNQLSTINLISNKKLLAFVANENQLKTVDVRVNTALVWIDVDDNLLENLTLKNGNNTIITQFSATGNSNLTCIEVDNVGFSETNWTNKDATANFSGDCAPANDDCAFAIPLVFGQETPGDINNGTFTNATDCVAGTIIADVWYSIIIPETGEFSIEGAGFGGLLKFAVYESCASSSAVSCGVNISLTNLNPGDVYYLKVWMEEASTSNKSSTSEAGTFTITANNSSVLSVDDFTRENIDLVVFPNPAKSNISILLSNGANLQKIEIYSILGDKIISHKNLNQTKTTIDISHLSSGIYFIRAKVDDKIMTKKLIIR